jgi:hypothetical protein
MATRYIGIVSENPQVGRAQVVGAASGGTLAGGQVVQVVFNDAIFTSAQEGKQRLLAALEAIEQAIELARAWPISTSS